MIPPVSPEALATLCHHHHVARLEAFGSCVRGEERPDSDMDLLVEFEPQARIGFLGLARLSRELGVLFGRVVDLVPRAGLKPLIRDEVLSHTQVLFAA